MKVNVTYGPPGTGKSRHLVEEVSGFLDRFKAKNALMCSHTKAAAATIRERWAGNTNDKRLQAGTLHSYCFEKLRLNRGQVVDDAKITEFLESFGLDMVPGSDGVHYMELINYAKAMDLSPMEVYSHSRRDAGGRSHFEAVANSYEKWKDTYGYVDFNDMLIRYCRLNLAPQFNFLAVDEAQDLSILHWRVIYNMVEQKRSQIDQVLVVGDDDQALFTYAGVDPQGMKKFSEKYDDTTVSVLSQSYRVPRKPHALAQKIIGQVANRHPKVYKPTKREGLVRGNESGWYLTRNLVPDRDNLIVYADRYRRENVEELLKEAYVPYVAVSGMPSPLQTAGGVALTTANSYSDTDMDDGPRATIRRGLSPRAAEVWDRIGPDRVIERLQQRDLSMIRVHWSNEDYLRNVKLNEKLPVRIGTLHGVKGMEADVVHMYTGVSPAAMEEAQHDPDSLHRLFYVGATRTKDQLFIYDDENSYEVPL